MPTEKLSMRKIKQILQLHHESGLSRRAISITVGTRYGSVANYLNRAQKAGISRPLPEGVDEPDLGRCCSPVNPLLKHVSSLSLTSQVSIRSSNKRV